MDKRKTFNKAISQLEAHRKKWLPNPVRDKRYIRGAINAKIKELINPRQRGDLTTDESVREIVLAKTGGRCFYCKRKYTTDPSTSKLMPQLYFSALQIDHLVPHSKFGPNSIANYVPACARCNQLKSDMTLAEFMPLLSRDMRKRGY